MLPVALEPLTKALPRRFSKRQIVDYSDRAARDRAALQLAGGLATLSAAPPLPDPLPEPPAAPLSYLTDLVDLVADRKELVHDQQRQILNHLESALRSVDPDERRGGYEILVMLSSRDDLYADVYRTINRLKGIAEDPASVRSGGQSTTEPSSVSVAADPSALIPDTILGDSSEKTTQQPGHTIVDEGPARPAANTPIDVVDRDGSAGKRLIRQLFLSEVGPRGRRYNPKIVASAVLVALVTLAAIVAVAMHTRPNSQQLSSNRASSQKPYRAYVLAPNPGLTGANVYAEPKLSSPLVGNLPVSSVVNIDCVSKGDPVEGPGVQGQPRQSTDLWDKVRPEGDSSDLGFVPDAWINTNGTKARAAFC